MIQMKAIHYLYIFLFGLFSLQACNTQPEEDKGTPAKATNAVPAVVPPPSVYASNKEGWLVDLDEAYARSVKENKPILANFTGSDWCGWCIKLDKDVFSKSEFQEWAKKNVVLLELDFPRRMQIPEKNRQQNAAMQQALQIRGYPTIWAITLDKDETTGKYQINQLGSTGYTPSPEEFINTIDQFIHPM
jgi:thioredoxin-related protein